MLFEATRADSVQKAEGPETVDVSSVLGHLERDLDVRLRTKVVDLGWLDLCDDVDKVGTVAQVTVVQLESPGV